LKRWFLSFLRDGQFARPVGQVGGFEMVEALEPIAIGAFTGEDVEFGIVDEGVGEGMAFAEAGDFAAGDKVLDVENMLLL